MKLSPNFTLEEMTYSPTAKIKKISNIPSEAQVINLKRLCREVLQPIRDKWEKPINITSGFRSRELNKAVRGSKSSQHLTGEAADISTSDNLKLWNIICRMILNGEIEVGQLIDEKNFKWIHISLADDRHKNQILHL